MREKDRKCTPIYFDNEIDITDELSPLDQSHRYHHPSTMNTNILKNSSSSKDIMEMDITDIEDNELRNKQKLSGRRVSMPVTKVYIKRNHVITPMDTRRDSYSPSEKSWNSESVSIRSGSSSSSRSSSTSDVRENNLLDLINDNNNSLVGSDDTLDTNTLYSDCDSVWDEDEKSKFHVKFVNRFGRKGKEDEELQNATNVCHVYQDAILVTDMLNNKLLLFARSGRPRKSFVTEQSSEPWASVVTPKGYIAVTLRRKRCVEVWSARGDTIFQFGSDILQCPTGLAVNKKGQFIVTDEELNDVFIFSPGGYCLRSLGGRFKQPRYVCVSNSGKILVSDSGHHCVKVFDSHGTFLYKFGSYGSANDEMKFPYGISVDQDENIYVADHYNDRVTLYDINGNFIQHLVTHEKGIRRPRGLSVRCEHDRKLYITCGGLKSTEIAVYKLVDMNSRFQIHVKCHV